MNVVNDVIDWRAGMRTAALLTKPGPRASTEERQALVAELRQAAVAAAGHVGAITQLPDAAAIAGAGEIYVVDRMRLVQANCELFATVTEGNVGRPRRKPVPQLTGAEFGAVLSMLSSRILGQYDPFTMRPGGARGRLLVVAPNVLRFERELNVQASDFRLWVCLHEQTHAVQFAAAPWLADYLIDRIGTLLRSLPEEDDVTGSATAVLRALPKIFSDDDDDELTPPALAGIVGEAEREILAQITATMSLLEGHADVVMDAVGPKVVRSIEQIRPKFDARRVAHGRIERTLRRLMGLEAKLAQYQEGAAFVRQVLAAVGHEGLAAVFASPDNLPTLGEIGDPDTWIARVHG